MLVLSRKEDETIVIQVPAGPARTITIKMAEATGRVRVGVDAPIECVVLRGELVERMAEQNRRDA